MARGGIFMQQKNDYFALAMIAMVATVAIVGIIALYSGKATVAPANDQKNIAGLSYEDEYEEQQQNAVTHCTEGDKSCIGYPKNTDNKAGCKCVGSIYTGGKCTSKCKKEEPEEELFLE
jgi:hypothetical protein